MWENITEDAKEGAMFSTEGSELLKLYQNPVEADKLLKVQRDLDEVSAGAVGAPLHWTRLEKSGAVTRRLPLELPFAAQW